MSQNSMLSVFKRIKFASGTLQSDRADKLAKCRWRVPAPVLEKGERLVDAFTLP